jgi:hypothetical protein
MSEALPAEDGPRQSCPDISLARAKLGWRPKVGLEVTIGYFKALRGDRRAFLFAPRRAPRQPGAIPADQADGRNHDRRRNEPVVASHDHGQRDRRQRIKAVDG